VGPSRLPERAPQSSQSVPTLHELNSAPGPPSSQSVSEAYRHELLQPSTAEPDAELDVGGGGEGEGGGGERQVADTGEGGGGEGEGGGGFESVDEEENCEHDKEPHALSPSGGGGEGTGGDIAGTYARTPQSLQSVPSAQYAYSEPCPPSSQVLALGTKEHSLVHPGKEQSPHDMGHLRRMAGCARR